MDMRLTPVSMRDRCAMTRMRSDNRRIQKAGGTCHCAMTILGDNDTSVQSQPCRNAGPRNEGGSGDNGEVKRAYERGEPTHPWLFPADPGRRGQIWINKSFNQRCRDALRSCSVATYIRRLQI